MHAASAFAKRSLFALLLLAASGCNAQTSTAPATGDPTVPQPPPGEKVVRWDTTEMTIKGKKFTMEVAESEEQITRGLMFRKEMKDDHGMLFVFDPARATQFWMKNTWIPLDIIFVNPAGQVTAIYARRPLDETGTGPETLTQYVIELNVGMAEKLGLKMGDKVEIPKKYLKTTPAPSDK